MDKHANYRETHREVLRKKAEAYRATPASKKKQQKYDQSPKGVVAHYRNASKRRGFEWALPHLLAMDLVTDNCYYCGQPPQPVNGIDRVDNSGGYVTDNVVTSCRMCNVAKNNHSQEEFLLWVQRVARNFS